MDDLTEHTPGPWHVILGRMTEDGEVFGFGVFPDKPTLDNLPERIQQHSLASGNLYEHSAFSAFYPPKVIEANAHLIAAAPDMLAALQRIEPDLYAASEIARIARAAIAKATGVVNRSNHEAEDR